jgi:hypothetical protein
VDEESPLEHLLRFYPMPTWQSLVAGTNMRFQLKSQLLPVGTKRKWKNVTLSEMMIWHAIVIGMTLVKLPNYRLYWTCTATGCFQGGDFGRFMSCNRWESIKRFLGFAVADEDEKDPLHRLRPFITSLSLANRQYMEPGNQVAVDEAMIGGKLRCFLIKTVKGKPTPTGFRVWCVCDSKTGYLHRFFVNDDTEKSKYPWAHVGEAVVLHLTEHLPMGTYVYCDRLFTTPRLAIYLLHKRHVYLVGTVKGNTAGFPKAETSKRCIMPAGQSLYQPKSTKAEVMCFQTHMIMCLFYFCLFFCQLRGLVKLLISQDGAMVASSWLDTGVVYMISVRQPYHARTFVMRMQKSGHPMEVKCLLGHKMFNAHMGGVDNFDHMRQGNLTCSC